MRTDFLDFPTAWALQREVGTMLNHHPRCSSVPGWDPISGPHFLCDCGAIRAEWLSRRAAARPETVTEVHEETTIAYRRQPDAHICSECSTCGEPHLHVVAAAQPEPEHFGAMYDTGPVCDKCGEPWPCRAAQPEEKR